MGRLNISCVAGFGARGMCHTYSRQVANIATSRYRSQMEGGGGFGDSYVADPNEMRRARWSFFGRPYQILGRWVGFLDDVWAAWTLRVSFGRPHTYAGIKSLPSGYSK